MVYPRRCPLCGADYLPGKVERQDHATVRAEAGGTPSPSLPTLPGRLLTLCCRACGGGYVWDYFAGEPKAPPGQVPRPPQPAGG